MPVSLKRKALGALWWTGAQNLLDEALRLLIFLALARLLTPEIYGQMALIGVYLAVVHLFVEQGFSRALVQREGMRAEHLDTAFWSQMLLGLALCAASVFAADFIARLLGEPELAPVLKAIALLIPLGAVNAVQQALLERELRRALPTLAKLAGTIAGGVAGVTLAILGSGIWSLVVQQLLSVLLTVLIVWSACAWRPGRKVSMHALKELLGFSSSLMGVSGLTVLKKQGDKFLVGMFLGAAALGLYATAQRLIETLTHICIRPISTLGLPVLSRLQNQPDALRAAYCRMVQATSAGAFPVFFGLFILAPEIVAVVLGPQWERLAILLRILAAMGLFQAVYLVDAALILSRGANLTRFKLNAVYVLMALLLYFLFVRFGLEALCAAAVFAAFAFLPLELRVVNKLVGIGVRDHLRNLWPATLASVVMTAAIIAAKQSFMAGWNDGQTLAACLVLGVVVYGLSLLCADRSLLSLLMEFLRQGPLRRNGRGSGPLSSADSGTTAIGAERKAV